ncbi:hypothetical protein [Streptomyces fagopyri]|uniref:hypothetical protein n=1 Tax=Streptomyces fagopyri TaxID=2662397 RepID=UPI00371C8982
MLIPFQLAAKAADLGLCMCCPEEQVEWLGGAPALAALFPQASVLRSKIISRVHPDDRKDVRRLVSPAAAQSPWIRLRFLTERDGWRVLAGQVRRIQLGCGGPERAFVVIRDDTQSEAHRQETLAEASAERERADAITASFALFSAATEQELQQVVLASNTGSRVGPGDRVGPVPRSASCARTGPAAARGS